MFWCLICATGLPLFTTLHFYHLKMSFGLKLSKIIMFVCAAFTKKSSSTKNVCNMYSVQYIVGLDEKGEIVFQKNITEVYDRRSLLSWHQHKTKISNIGHSWQYFKVRSVSKKYPIDT